MMHGDINIRSPSDIGGVKIGNVLIYDIRGQEVLPIMPRHEWRCAMFSGLVHNLDSDGKMFMNGE